MVNFSLGNDSLSHGRLAQLVGKTGISTDRKRPLNGMSPKELKEERFACIEAAKAYHDQHSSRWDDAHDAAFAALMARADECEERARNLGGMGGIRMGSAPSSGDGFGSGVTTLVDSRGNEMVMVGRDTTLASVTPNIDRDCAYPMGEYLRARVTGVTSATPPSIAAAISTGNATSAGYLVPRELSTNVIDLARAKSVLINAGVQTIQLKSNEYSIAQLRTDPTMSVKLENEYFDRSDITIGKVVIQPRMIGCLLPASREVIEDSPNAAQVIENALAKSLANAVDNMGINGSGTGQAIMGILNYTEIDGNAATGAASWTALANAAKEVRLNNHEPNAAIVNTSVDHQLKMSADTTGQWLVAPPTLNFPMYESTNVPLDSAVVGDWNYFAWGIRQQAEIEVTTQSDEAFGKHQVHFKIYFRADTALLDPSAFHKLSGITVS